MFGQSPDLESEGLAAKTSLVFKPVHICTFFSRFSWSNFKNKASLWFPTIFPNPLFKHHARSLILQTGQLNVC